MPYTVKNLFDKSEVEALRSKSIVSYSFFSISFISKMWLTTLSSSPKCFRVLICFYFLEVSSLIEGSTTLKIEFL
jgi:hypothetical protein